MERNWIHIYIYTRTHTYINIYVCMFVCIPYVIVSCSSYTDSFILLSFSSKEIRQISSNKLEYRNAAAIDTYTRKNTQFSCSVVSNSLQPHGLQHARPPCPSPAPRVYPTSCPLSRWCHPTISFTVIPFSSCLQSFRDQGLFKWVSSLHHVAKVLEFQLLHQSFQWIFRTDFL